MTTSPPGWYDDGQGSLRWWDGGQWTDDVHAPDAAATPVADEPGLDQPAAPEDAEPDLATALGFGEPSPAASADDGASAAATSASPGGSAALAPAQSPGTYPGSYTAHPAAAPVPPLTHGAQHTANTGVATERAPARSSLWWVWLVAGGAVLIVLIVLALVFVPVALRAITGGATVGGDSAEEQAAVATVQAYDRAWQSIDCDLIISSTTEGFRQDFDLTDCEVFEEQALNLAATTRDYELTITAVDTRDDGTVVVETTESFVSRLDEEGNDTGSEQTYTDDYAYLVVSSSDAWLIDDQA